MVYDMSMCIHIYTSDNAYHEILPHKNGDVIEMFVSTPIAHVRFWRVKLFIK